MKNTILILMLVALMFTSCEQKAESGGGSTSGDTIQKTPPNADFVAEDLKQKGYQTFTYTQGDSTYLMQQYYVVFLRKGKNRSQDSIQAAKLQEQHLLHLSSMYEQGYTSLTGPMGDDGEIRGIVIYNTPTIKEADSLARLDPMVQAGRLEVEVRPWWTAKGGKLN